DVKKGALLVPQRAVTELQGSYRVAVVGPDDKVDIRAVEPGERIGDAWVIEKGLQPGENVIVAGLQLVKPGMVGKPKPAAGDEAKGDAKTDGTSGDKASPAATAQGARAEGR